MMMESTSEGEGCEYVNLGNDRYPVSGEGNVFTAIIKEKLGTTRVQAYSDAVLSIVATLLVVPLLKVSEDAKLEMLFGRHTLFQALISGYRLQMYAMLWVAFWIVFLVWIWHQRKFSNLEEAPQIVVNANWFELLAVSLLPLTASMASSADSMSEGSREESIRMLYWNVLGIATAHIIFQVIALKTRSIWFFGRMYLEEAGGMWIVCVLTVGISYIKPHLAIFTYILLAIVYWFSNSRLRKSALDRKQSLENQSQLNEDEEDGLQEAIVILNEDETVNHKTKDRMEQFTDGVVAIAATLIVLDIHAPAACDNLKNLEECLLHWQDGCRPQPTLNPFVEPKCLYDDEQVWGRYKWLVIAYVLSFMTINVLWMLHNYLFQRIVKASHIVDGWTLFLNGHFCLMVSLMPFAWSLVTDYAIEPVTKHKIDPTKKSKRFNPDEDAAATAVVFLCCIMYLASACLAGILIHHTWLQRRKRPLRRDIFFFLLIPIVSFSTALVAAYGEEQMYLCLLFLVPFPFLAVRTLMQTATLDLSTDSTS